MRRGGPIHLLEVGLIWPPETFLGWKLSGLNERGLRITVAAIASRRQARRRLPGVRVRRQPDWDEQPRRVLPSLAWGLLRLLLSRPHRLPAVVEAARHPLRPPVRPSAWRTLLRLRAYLPLARLRPDVVHFEWNSAAIVFLPMTRVWRCPVVVSCHGSDVNVRARGADGARWRASLAASFAQASAVHCVSEAILAEAVSHGLDPDKAWLIRPAVDPDVFRPGSAGDADALRIVTVADFRWLKAHEYALVALRDLLDRGVPARLEVLGGDPDGAVGEGSTRRRIAHTVQDLGLGAHVELRGRVDSDRVRRTLARADVLLHLSLTEGLSTSMLEAMACGLPVVVSDSEAVREAVADGVEGLVVPLRDPRAAADALEQLWAAPDRRAALGDAGRRRVLADFRLDRQLDSFVELYRQVATLEAPSPCQAAVVAPDVGREDGHDTGPADLRVLAVGPLSWTSGLEYALQAVRFVQDAGVRCECRVVGEGDYHDGLAFARHQLGLEEAVHFLSPRGQDLDSLLEWADVLVDASVVDGESPAAPAARAAEVPIVGTATLPRRDPRSLAEALVSRAAAAGPRPAGRAVAPPR